MNKITGSLTSQASSGAVPCLVQCSVGLRAGKVFLGWQWGQRSGVPALPSVISAGAAPQPGAGVPERPWQTSSVFPCHLRH